MASLGEILGAKSQQLQASANPAPAAEVSVDSSATTATDGGGSGEQSPATPADNTAQAPAATHEHESSDLHDTDIVANEKAPKWARDAVVSERKKRQEYERQIAEMQGRLQTLQQFAQPQQAQQKPQAEEAPNFYADPERYISRQLEAVKAEQASQRMSMSAAMVRTQHPDYDEVLPAFMEAVRNAPYLEQQVMNHPHPAMFAYETGKTYLEARKYGGSLEEMKKKLREELRVELEAELKKASSVSAAENANKSTAGARGTGAATAAQFTGPTPLDSILPRDRFVKRRA